MLALHKSLYFFLIALMAPTVLMSSGSYAAAPKAPAAPAAAKKLPPKFVVSKADQAKLAFNAGNRLAMTGKIDAAIQKYLDALNLDPSLDLAYTNLGVMYARKQLWPQAEEAFRRVTLLKPNDVQAVLRLGVIQKQGGQPGAARDTFTRAVGMAPNNVDIRLALGETYEGENQAALAEEQFKAATAANPTSLKAARALTGFYFRHKRMDEYQAMLDRIWPLDSGNDDLAFNIGLGAQRKKEWGKAVTFYKAALRLNPRNHAAWQNLGVVYSELKRPGDAAGSFSRAARLDKGNSGVQMGLGITQFQAGHYAAAETAFRQVLKSSPKNAQAQMNLAFSLLRQKKLKEAEPLLAKLRAGGNTDLDVLHSLAFIYATTGQRDRAVELYRKAIQADPDNLENHRNLASLYLQANKNDDAISELKEMLRISPQEKSALTTLAVLYSQANRTEEAVPVYETLAEKDPSAYLQLAGLQRIAGKTDEEIATLQKWTTAAPQNPDAWVALSSAYELQKKLPEAREALDKARGLKPKETRYARVLAEFERRNGNAAGAETTLREALKVTPSDPVLLASLGDVIAETKAPEAIQRFQAAEANEKDPRLAAQYALRAVRMMKKANDPQADAQLQRILQRHPKDQSVLIERATLLGNDKKYQEAMAQAYSALTLNPDSFPDGQRALQLYVAYARLGGKAGEAIAALQGLLEKHPQSSSLLFALSPMMAEYYIQQKTPPNDKDPGLVYLRALQARHPDINGVPWTIADYMGRRDMNKEMVALLESLAAKDPKAPTAPYALGSFYKQQQQWDKAETAFTEAIKRSPKALNYRMELATVQEAAGKKDMALETYRDAEKLEPSNPQIQAAIARLTAPPAPRPGEPPYAPAPAVPSNPSSTIPSNPAPLK